MSQAQPMIRVDPNTAGAVLIEVKAVPGASRDQIAGALGDRLKIRISAPPEGGKANAAICRLLADALGLPNRAVEVISGQSRAEKTIRAAGITPDAAKQKLGV